MAYVSEYSCGCIYHELAGQLRKCEGMTSRSLSGRMVAKGDGAEKRHNEAMEEESVRQYIVANVVR